MLGAHLRKQPLRTVWLSMLLVKAYAKRRRAAAPELQTHARHLADYAVAACMQADWLSLTETLPPSAMTLNGSFPAQC